jgi:hypothetical protein
VDVEPGRVLRRTRRDGDGPHLDGLEAVHVLPRVGLYRPFPQRRARRDEHDRRGGASACPRVAGQLADVVLTDRRVAEGLRVRDIVEIVRSSSFSHSIS